MGFFGRGLTHNAVCKRICVLLTICLLLTVFCLPVSGAETSAPASSDTPALVSSDTPALVSSDTPALVSSDTPALVSSDTPALVSSDTPALVSSDTPALVSQEYLQKQLEALRKELLEVIAKAVGNASDLPALDGPQESAYRDVTLPRGSVVTLGDDAEVIFRGGYAVVLTVSEDAGAGLADLVTGEESFSGTLLQFAHIYYKSAPGGRVSLLVTGDKAAFTLKGTYDIS